MHEREVFNAARQLASADERHRYLDDACCGDAPLRARVEELLQSYDQAGGFLQHPAFEDPGTVDTEADSSGASPEGSDRSQLDVSEVSLHFLSPTSEADALGSIGAYIVTEVVGVGGMGVVLKAQDRKLNRIVAVKVLAPELAGNATARRRFVREAQAAAAVAHPHIVAIYAVDEDQLPFLVMEYVDGVSLQEKIERSGHLQLKEILRIGMQIASGLEAAHKHGVIHRDIKPANILLENGVERVRITDFGLARAVDDVAMTRTGEVAGTPQYMSPEQAQGGSVDARSDLFSLGSVLYAMCTGRSPFRAETTMGCLHRVCDDSPRPIREINADVPKWLAEIVNRLLEKRPENRFQTAGEVASLLGQHLARVQDPHSMAFPGASRTALRVTPMPARRRQRWVVAALALVALIAGFSTTEAIGITQVSATVIRIVNGEGTLVIEVDDPTVQVSLDGEELSITGAGLREVTLQPGQYQFEATKDGETLKRELVTITRGRRRVVRVTYESAPAGTREAVTGQSAFPGIDSDKWIWTAPVNLGSTVNSEYQEAYPVVSADELTLILGSDRPGGMGQSDLWQCTRSSIDDPWNAPVHLGDGINTEFMDIASFLSADGLTLYVSSDRPGGQGHWDIWEYRRETPAAPWFAADNLGLPINGPWSDGSPYFTPDGLIVLFHSNRPGSMGGGGPVDQPTIVVGGRLDGSGPVRTSR